MNWKITITACMLVCSTFVQATNKSEVPFYPTTPGVVMHYETRNSKGELIEQMKDSIATFSGDFNKGVAITMSKVNKENMRSITLEKLMLFKEGEVIVDMASFMINAFKEGIRQSIAQHGASEEEVKEIEKAMEDIRIEGELRGMPLHPTIGMKLPDYSVSFEILFMSIKIQSTKRKITGEETIKTKAGTFDCYIVEETVEVSSSGASEKNTAKTWYARGIGQVRSETYQKKKLVSRTELTSIQ